MLNLPIFHVCLAPVLLIYKYMESSSIHHDMTWYREISSYDLFLTMRHSVFVQMSKVAFNLTLLVELIAHKFFVCNSIWCICQHCRFSELVRPISFQLHVIHVSLHSVNISSASHSSQQLTLIGSGSNH